MEQLPAQAFLVQPAAPVDQRGRDGYSTASDMAPRVALNDRPEYDATAARHRAQRIAQ